MTYTYNTTGTCSRAIEINIADDGTIREVRFDGGCSGNTAGIAALAKGMKPTDLIARLRGIRCGSKPTSCPDQLARALEQIDTHVKQQESNGRGA